MLKCTCPHCGAPVYYPDQMTGAAICRSCMGQVQLPTRTASIPIAQEVGAVRPMSAVGPGVKHFFTKAVGVTQGNRQQILAKLRRYEMLDLVHEEDNPVDPTAVALYSNGQQVGYLRKELAREVVKKSGQGWRYAVFVKEVTGATSRQNLGCNLLVVVGEPSSADAEAQAYINQVIETDPQFVDAAPPRATTVPRHSVAHRHRPNPSTDDHYAALIILALAVLFLLGVFCLFQF